MSTFEPVTFTLTVNAPDKYSRLIAFCLENGIQCDPLKGGTFKEIILDTVKRKPTQEYSEFCGKENLNRFGLVSEKDVYDTVMRYLSSFGLIQPDQTLQFDAKLQAALKTDRTRFYQHELPYTIRSAFP
jgi:hypothetical protein